MEKQEKNRVESGVEWDRLGISNDFMFGKVMQNPELCRELLQRILPNLEIDHLEYPELQKEIRSDVEAKSVRLDVYVRDGKDTVYNIEMQVADTKELPKRTRYYQSMIDLQMIDKGESYKQLKPSYIIFICLSDVYGEGRHIYTFENVCKENRNISLGDETTKIFLNADSKMDDVEQDLRFFLDYVNGGRPEDIFARKLDDAIKEAKKNREWRREYMTLLMRDRENLEKGIEQGIEQGIEKGILAMVSVLREYNIPDSDITTKIQEKFKISQDEAKKYL